MVYIYDLPEFKIPKEFQDGLVGAWNGQQSSDGSVVDLNGSGHNGTENGGVVLGRKNNAHFMQFDGSDDYIEYSKDRQNKGASFSVISIFKILNSQNGSVICLPYDTNYNSDSYHGAFIDSDNNIITTGIYSKSNHWQNIQLSPIITNKVFHIASVYDGSKLYGYLNGTYKGQISNSFDNELPKFKIGRNYYGDGQSPFNGQIGLILIYNKVLSSNQIQKMYEYFRQWYYD